jgi:hypothetical protein
VEPVKTELVLDPEKDQDAAGHSDSQAGDVDEGEDLVFNEVSPGGPEIVCEHGLPPIQVEFGEMRSHSGMALTSRTYLYHVLVERLPGRRKFFLA